MSDSTKEIGRSHDAELEKMVNKETFLGLTNVDDFSATQKRIFKATTGNGEMY